MDGPGPGPGPGPGGRSVVAAAQLSPSWKWSGVVTRRHRTRSCGLGEDRTGSRFLIQLWNENLQIGANTQNRGGLCSLPRKTKELGSVLAWICFELE